MARGTRRSSQGSNGSTRDKILEAAEAMIGEQGVEGFQLKDLAEAVGIRTPSLFAHFEGRDAIIEAVAIRLLDNISRTVSARDRSGDPVEVLRSHVSGFVRYLAENRAAAHILIREIGRPGSAGLGEREGSKQRIDALESDLAALMRWGIRRGIFRRVRPEAVMAQMVGAATANVVWLDEGDGPPPGLTVKRLQRETTELILRYVVKERSSG